MAHWRGLAGAVAAVVGLAAGTAQAAEERDPASSTDQRAERTMDEVGEAYEAVKGYSFEKKDELVSWFNRQMEQLDREMEALRAEAEEAGERAKAKWPEAKEELAERREAAEHQLDRLQEASADVWDGVKEATASAVERLDEAIDRAATRFDDEPQS